VHLKLVAAKAAAVVASSCAASMLITGLVVYADANPNNHGHHYGQLKHQHAPGPAPQPPPAPAPVPKPNAPAVVPIVSHPNAAIAQPIASPVSGGATLPLPDLGGQDTTQKQAVAALPPVRDPNLWVVEALLPALLIVWLIWLAVSRGLQKQNPDGKVPAG
jgi:hypothetical protein